MSEIVLQRQPIKGYFQKRVLYVLKDKPAMFVFISIYIKTLLFMNILDSSGASKLSLTFDTVYLYHVVSLFFILGLISFSFLTDKSGHLLLLIVTNLLFSIILVGDLWYFRGFNDFLSFHLLGELNNLNNLSNSVLSMSRPIDIIFIADNLVLILFFRVIRKKHSNFGKLKGTFTMLFGFSLLTIMLLHISLDYNGKNYKGPEFFKTQWVSQSTMRNLSPLGYHLYDTYVFIEDNRPYKMSNAEKSKIKDWFAYKNENLPDNQYKGMLSEKNLIIIQVESLENFVINNKHEGQEITPNLNKLLKNSLYFSNIYEQVNNGNSADADLMINTSLFPVRRGSTFFRFPNNNYNTLPKMLNKLGYTSRALHSDYGYYWNVEKALANFDFHEFKDIRGFDSSDVFWMGLTDESFFKQVNAIAVKDKDPFYYFTVTSTSHSPFEIPENFKGLQLSEAFDKTYMGGYFQSIHYTDKQIGRFIDSLERDGILDNSIIAIYGDHNGVHKYYSDEVSKLSEKEAWWENEGRVPFIVYSKNIAGEELKTIGGQIDMLPTLAYTLGIKKELYENSSLGRNLLNSKRSFALQNNGNIVGRSTLNEEEIKHIEQSFEISDRIIRSNYFKRMDE